MTEEHFDAIAQIINTQSHPKINMSGETKRMMEFAINVVRRGIAETLADYFNIHFEEEFDYHSFLQEALKKKE